MIKLSRKSLIVGLAAIALVFCVSSGASAKTVLKMNHQLITRAKSPE